MQELRNQYLQEITKYKKELRELEQEKNHRKTLNLLYPTSDLDAKIAHRKRKLQKAIVGYEGTYNV